MTARRRSLRLALTLFAVLVPTAGGADSPTVVTVNGEALSLRDVELYLGRVHDAASPQGGQRSVADLDRLMFRLVNDTLLAQEARALGLDREAPIPDRVEAYRRRLLVAALEREEIAERSQPTDSEVRQTFERQYRELTLQVVTAYQRPDAEGLLAELRAGAGMDALARDRSVDPYAGRGGRVDRVDAIDLQPEIAELASTLAPGELGGPVRTDLGWTVVRLLEAGPPGAERFAQVETTVRRLVRHRKSQALRAALARAARERHAVTVDQALTGSLEARRLPDARLVPELAGEGDVIARVAVTVDQQLKITTEDYRRALLARWSGVRNAESALAAAPGVLDELIEKRLLLAEALARSYGRRSEIRTAVRAFETSLLAPRYLEQAVASEARASREELESYYRTHQDELLRPPRIHVGQITVATGEEARRVADLLRQGTDLAWLARRHSIDRFADRGGDRGWIEPGSSGFDERLWDAAPGDVLDPTGVRGNFIVLKVTARQERGPYPFEEVSGNVRNAVETEKTRAAIARLMDTLRERSEIAIDRELLATVRLGGSINEASEASRGHGH